VRDGDDAHVVVERGGQPERSDNERSEFLGDAVLDLVVSDVLMRRFPDRREGDLSRARAALVSESRLAQVRGRDRSRAVHPARQGRGAHGRRARPSILANALEALMGAIYVDAGFDAAAAVAARLFEGGIEDVDQHAQLDYKSRLQERAQALWQTRPSTRWSPRRARPRQAVRGGADRCAGARTAARSAGRRRRRSRARRPPRWRRSNAR
jgi:dsRNA-specific ribonuclease